MDAYFLKFYFVTELAPGIDRPDLALPFGFAAALAMQ